MTQSYIDSHCHLDDPAFDADRDAVIERARAAGIKFLLSIGGSEPETFGSGIALAERYDWIFTTVGLHPHEAKRFDAQVADSLQSRASHPKVLAIGEIGLDYYYDHSPREAQKLALLGQLEIARQAKRPIVIHCREAWTDLAEIIETHWQSSGLGGILHCFGGSREEAFKFMDWGFLISFAGNVTFKKAEGLREVAREIPLDRLLVETDSPYLAPVPHRGKRNEPSYVVEVARTLAGLRGLDEAVLGNQIVENFTRFFHLGLL